MILQAINDIASRCAALGVNQAILSPGSRCAPITLAFVRHPDIDTKTISDERSAAFIALGIAQQSRTPVVLVCTSGSAALNYAPAVAEAFFQQIPLIIITADRPPEWIGQLDGQTIHQQNIYGRHVKASYQAPTETNSQDASWHLGRMVAESVHLAKSLPAGPVHINVPLREPFYPDENEDFHYSDNLKSMHFQPAELGIAAEVKSYIEKQWPQYTRKLIIVGQQTLSPELTAILTELSQKRGIPILGDVLSNIHGIDNAIRHQDLFLMKKDEDMIDALRPDMLISIGQSVISKNLKIFLRSNPPKTHWHIQEHHQPAADTFQHLTAVFPMASEDFFKHINTLELLEPFSAQQQHNYNKVWQIAENNANDALTNNALPFGEFSVIRQVLQQLPAPCELHLANSMAVRYANFAGIYQKDVQVWCNRGTSGIDGSTSTLMGHALAAPEKWHILLTGDMAFLYDRNAFWHNYLPDNIRIVVLNNNAGGIFRLIDGPAKQPELQEFFETRQALSAENFVKDYAVDYFFARDERTFRDRLPLFFMRDGKSKVLEVFSKSEDNALILKEFKQNIINYGKSV